METKKNKLSDYITTHEEFEDEFFGVKGTETRRIYEEGFEEFKLGVMLHEARLKKGFTQQELADKCGTTKSYISKIENGVKEVKVSTLRRIIERGLGGHLSVSIEV